MTENRYRILQQHGTPGRLAFAEIWIGDGESSTDTPVLEGVEGGNYDDWKLAAANGLERAVERAALEFGLERAALHVARIRATVVDSTCETISCAAEAATYIALGWSRDQVTTGWTDDRCSVVLAGPPARMPTRTE